MIEPMALRRQLLPALAVPLVLLGFLHLGIPFTRAGDVSRLALAAPGGKETGGMNVYVRELV